MFEALKFKEEFGLECYLSGGSFPLIGAWAAVIFPVRIPQAS